ncbi:aminodeoxychorismate lyase [Actinocorallia longicatena]|uniref:aminodeoxychorismate lyase n=1 Tax=Actinocorallia longicatena TaxID=111803 RepID=A0ABP6Q8F8_9ACTN
MRVWVNGELGRDQVSVIDHGITVGDGVFETIKIVRGAPFALTRHLDRLAFSARGLGLPEPDDAAVRRGVAEILDGAAWELGRLRITYTGGPGPLGSDRGPDGPTTILLAGEQKPFPDTGAIAVVPWPRNERGPLSGLKTISYADNVIALARAKAQGAGEAIFGNLAGNLCEGTGSNIFLVKDGRVITPPLSSGCLAGVTRALVTEWMDVDESDVPLQALYEADEVFLTSTTRDVQPVSLVDGREIAVGPVTRKAREIFLSRAAEHVDP